MSSLFFKKMHLSHFKEELCTEASFVSNIIIIIFLWWESERALPDDININWI